MGCDALPSTHGIARLHDDHQWEGRIEQSTSAPIDSGLMREKGCLSRLVAAPAAPAACHPDSPSDLITCKWLILWSDQQSLLKETWRGVKVAVMKLECRRKAKRPFPAEIILALLSNSKPSMTFDFTSLKPQSVGCTRCHSKARADQLPYCSAKQSSRRASSSRHWHYTLLISARRPIVWTGPTWPTKALDHQARPSLHR